MIKPLFLGTTRSRLPGPLRRGICRENGVVLSFTEERAAYRGKLCIIDDIGWAPENVERFDRLLGPDAGGEIVVMTVRIPAESCVKMEAELCDLDVRYKGLISPKWLSVPNYVAIPASFKRYPSRLLWHHALEARYPGIVARLEQEESTSTIANAYGLSSSRILQLRRDLENWSRRENGEIP